MPALSVRGKFYLVLGLTGLALRFILSAYSYGTNDTTSWQQFASAVRASGLAELYISDRLFNHPPLAALLVAFCHWLSSASGISFPFILRLPGILAEVGSAFLLLRICSRHLQSTDAMLALAIFGMSLVSILVSGYHGNTDCIYAFLGLLSLYLAHEKRAYAASGLVLGLAINVKLIPIFLVPALYVACPNFQARFRTACGFIPALIPFLWMWLIIPSEFTRNVFAYNSQRDYWGLQLFLLLFYGNYPSYSGFFSWLMDAYGSIGRYVIGVAIIATCAINLRTARLSAYELAALSYALFAVLAPGFSGQYFVIFPALILAFSLKWGLRVATLSGLLQLASYASFLVSLSPLRSEHTATAGKLTVLLAFLVWTALVVFTCELLRKLLPNSNNRTI